MGEEGVATQRVDLPQGRDEGVWVGEVVEAHGGSNLLLPVC